MFKQLLKIEFMSLLTMNNMVDSKKGKLKNPLTLLAGSVLVAATVLGVSALYSYALAVALIPYNAVDVLPVMIFTAGCLVVFFYGSLKSSSVLFSSKDFDLLMSMPIPGKTVIGAKLAYLYLSDLGFALGLMVPSLCVWIYYSQPPMLNIVLTFLALPFVPVIPLMVATLVGTLVAYISGFSRHKNIISTVANLVLVMGIMYLSFSFSGKAAANSDIAQIVLALKAQIFAQYPPARVFFGITQGEIYAFALFVGLSVILLAIYLTLISGSFVSIHSRLESATLTKSGAKVKMKAESRFGSLIRKEFDLFLATPIYVVNMAMGSLLCLGGLIYVIFFGQGYVQMFLDIPGGGKMLVYFAPLLVVMLLTLTAASSCNLSLEGQSLWLTKSLPVSAYSIFMAKVIFNLILTLPIGLLSCFVAAWLLELNVIWTIIYVLFVAGACLFSAFTGIILNIKFPNFDWTNPAKVVKQSVPVFITTFGSMLFVGLLFVGIGFLGQNDLIVQGIYGAISVMFIAVSWAVNHSLKKNGEKILAKLG